MTQKFRNVLRVASNEIDKRAKEVMSDAKASVDTTSEKVQKKLADIKSFVRSKYEDIRKQISQERVIAVQTPNHETHKAIEFVNNTTPLPPGIVKYWQWYQQLTGLDKVEVCRQQVNYTQDRLFNCQDDRRELHRQAIILQDKIKEVYCELLQTKRDDPKYVQLTILENRTLQDVGKLQTQLNLLEKAERDLFTQLATAIKEYHDSQNINALRYKYLSIVASALLAILSLISSIIYNNKRIMDIEKVVTKAQGQNQAALAIGFQTIQEQFNGKITELAEKLDHQDKSSTGTNFYTTGIPKKIVTVVVGLLCLRILFG